MSNNLFETRRETSQQRRKGNDKGSITGPHRRRAVAAGSGNHTKLFGQMLVKCTIKNTFN